MASLMENLIDVLGRESTEYEALLQLSQRKTPIIAGGDLAELQKITDEEQELVSRIHNLDRQRAGVTADIADVLNRDVKELKLPNLITMLSARLDALAAYHARIRVNRPRSSLAIDRERARRAATRAHAAADAHIHVIDDMSAQALWCRQPLLRIAHRNRLLDHRAQGRLGKCQQTHAAPTFPCS